MDFHLHALQHQQYKCESDCFVISVLCTNELVLVLEGENTAKQNHEHVCQTQEQLILKETLDYENIKQV